MKHPNKQAKSQFCGWTHTQDKRRGCPLNVRMLNEDLALGATARVPGGVTAALG